MLNFKTLLQALMVALGLLAAACSGGGDSSKSASTSAVTKEISANTFRNEYFGLTAAKPESWYAAAPEVIDRVMGIGNDIASSGNEDLKKIMDASTKRSHSIFMFSKYEFGAPVAFNPNVIGIAENVGFMPGIKTGKDYFFHVKKMMSQTAINIEFADGYKQRNIGGVPFDSMDLTMAMNGVQVKETYYAARHGDFVISFISIYGADEFEEEISAIIDAIALDWQ